MKKTKKAGFWLRRRSHLPMIIIGGIFISVLYFDDETSVKLNMEFDRQINALKKEIALNQDSAQYYRERREGIERGKADLEQMAREQFHMQRPTEDVFLLSDGPSKSHHEPAAEPELEEENNQNSNEEKR